MARIPSLAALILVEGRKILRLRSVWVLVAAVISLGTLSFFLPALPFHPKGLFSLQTFSSLDQLLATFLAVAALLAPTPSRVALWWPRHPALSWAMGVTGSYLALALILGLCLGLQLLEAAATGNLMAQDALSQKPIPLAPRYATLMLTTLTFTLVLHIWGQLLELLFHRAVALMVLLVLMLGGFLLTGLTQDSVAARLLLLPLPDLASLAPTQAVLETPPPLVDQMAYALVHVASVAALAALILEIRLRRGHATSA